MSHHEEEEPLNGTTTTVYASLNSLVINGIEVDRKLRQPSYYTSVNFEELKVEVAAILADLLTNQKVPCWLSQRIACFYSCRYFKQIANDLIDTECDLLDDHHLNKLRFVREKLVVHLRNSISNIIKEWLLCKKVLDKQNLLFSFARFEQDCAAIKYFEFGIKNKRRVMEDKVAIIENIDLIQSCLLGQEEAHEAIKKPAALFAVFDGHCGVDCAQYVSKHLPMLILQHPQFKHDINRVFADTFNLVNQKFTQKAKEESIRSGSTCCMSILTSDFENPYVFSGLDIAWCGDTRLCLVRNGKIVYLTEEHKPENEAEKSRILKAGGTVSFVSNAWRVNDSLAVSRSFGDMDYQPSVIAEPEVKHFDLDGSEDYFIIGCDGLWETLDLNELCSFVYEQSTQLSTQDNMAESLVKKAQFNGSADNITAIFVLLKDNLSQITKPC